MPQYPRVHDQSNTVDPSGTYGRNSLYLKSYVSTSNTDAANRTAYQQAVTDADAAGRPLCYDGAFFSFSGAAVRSTANGAIHWASATSTHKVTNNTRGQGVVRFAGTDPVVERLYLDGNNPALDLTLASTPSTSWWSFGICFEPTAHRARVRDLKVSGFMRGVLASSMTPESLDVVSDPNTVNTTTYPPLLDLQIDGIDCSACFTACQPLAVTGALLRGIRGSYMKATGSAADPHLIYINGWTASNTDIRLWNYNVTIDDCRAMSGPSSGNAFKARAVRGFMVENCTAYDCPGIGEFVQIIDFQIAGGFQSYGDISAQNGVGSFNILYGTRGDIKSAVISFANITHGQGISLDSCTDVVLDRPLVAGNSLTDQTGTPAGLINLTGPNPGCRVIEPKLSNPGTVMQAAILTKETSGGSGSNTAAKVFDPVVSGNFSYGARITLPGLTLYYNTDDLLGSTPISNIAAVGTVTLINRYSFTRYGARGWAAVPLGVFFAGSLIGSTTRTLAPTLNRLYAAPCYSGDGLTIDALQVNVNTGLATSVERVGIYMSTDPTTGLNGPWTLAVDAGTLDCSTVGTKSVTLGTPVIIARDQWFLVAGVMQVAAATMYVGGSGNGFSPLGGGYNTQRQICYYVAGVTGALPSTIGVNQTRDNVDGGVEYRRAA